MTSLCQAHGRWLLAGLFLWLATAIGAFAQADPAPLPQPRETAVNDFAGLLSATDAEALRARLTQLRNDSGIEGTVVTLPRDMAPIESADLEAYATRLFNDWGIGDAQRNDGFMVLVLPDIRAARIELGAGYPNDADIQAQDILKNVMLPAFREGDMSRGIRNGVEQVITYLIRAPEATPPSTWDRIKDRLPFIPFIAVWAVVIFMILRNRWRRGRCPQCGKRNLITTRTEAREPQPDGSYRIADDDVTRKCPDCGWQETRQAARPDIIWTGPTGEVLRRERNGSYRAMGRSGGSSGFGGGSSRGGGASGRW